MDAHPRIGVESSRIIRRWRDLGRPLWGNDSPFLRSVVLLIIRRPRTHLETKTNYIKVFNRGLRFFSEFVRVSLRRPSQALFFTRTVLWQGRAAPSRPERGRGGLTVPPIAIFSITNRCS